MQPVTLGTRRSVSSGSNDCVHDALKELTGQNASVAGSIDSARRHSGHLTSSSHSSAADDGTGEWLPREDANAVASVDIELIAVSALPPHLQWRQERLDSLDRTLQQQNREEVHPSKRRGQRSQESGHPQLASGGADPSAFRSATLPTRLSEPRSRQNLGNRQAQPDLQRESVHRENETQSLRQISGLSTRSLRLSGEDERCDAIERLHFAFLTGGCPNQRFEDMTRMLQDVFQMVPASQSPRYPLCNGRAKMAHANSCTDSTCSGVYFRFCFCSGSDMITRRGNDVYAMVHPQRYDAQALQIQS